MSHLSASTSTLSSSYPWHLHPSGLEEREGQPPGLSAVTRLQVRLEFLASRLIGVVMHPSTYKNYRVAPSEAPCVLPGVVGRRALFRRLRRLPAQGQRSSFSCCLLSPILLDHHLLPALWRLSRTSPLCTAGSRTATLSATSQTSMSSSQAVTRASGTNWPSSWMIEACGCWLLVSLRRGPRSFDKTLPIGCRPSSWMSPRVRAFRRRPSG